jgi:hypothetical protein
VCVCVWESSFLLKWFQDLSPPLLAELVPVSMPPLPPVVVTCCRSHVKKGLPPSISNSSPADKPGARRNASTSAAVLNCGRRVSNLVETRTVRLRLGSTCRVKVDRIDLNVDLKWD